jgi:hypothetical protein
VFNLEVFARHEFFVGEAGVRAHNGYADKPEIALLILGPNGERAIATGSYAANGSHYGLFKATVGSARPGHAYFGASLNSSGRVTTAGPSSITTLPNRAQADEIASWLTEAGLADEQFLQIGGREGGRDFVLTVIRGARQWSDF